MRVIRPDKLIKRSRGRHRRPRPETERRSTWAGALAAVLTLAWLANMPADRPPTAPSRMAGLTAEAGLPEDRTADDFLADESLREFVDPEHLAAVPVGAGRVAQPVGAVLSGARVIETLGESGIPDVALRAYKQAAARLAATDPSCGVPWTLLAAIGRVESNHGRFGGAELRGDGSGTMRIRGIPLDGRPNVVLIRDTDGGELDGDTTYDRAVGPMQFIPSTWRRVNADGNGDGRADPNNVFDAAQGAAVYLCSGASDLRDPNQAAQAVRRYNNADEYVRVVLSLALMYQTGRVVALPSLTGISTDDRRATAGTVRPPAIPWPWTSGPSPTPPVPRSSAVAKPPARVSTPTPRATPAPTDLAPATPTPPLATATMEPRPTAPTKPRVTAPTTPRATAPTKPSPATPQPGKTTAPEQEPSPEPTPTPAEPGPSADTTSATPAPSAEPPDTAAVGWAPAMRAEVVRVLKKSTTAPGPKPAVCPELATRPQDTHPKPSADCGRRPGKPTTPQPPRAR
jgi:membrane-bound lytic murein transglycosylase B